MYNLSRPVKLHGHFDMGKLDLETFLMILSIRQTRIPVTSAILKCPAMKPSFFGLLVCV